MLDYYLYKFGEWLVLSLPLRLAYKLGAMLASLHFLLSKKDRDAVINNLSVILPNENKLNIRIKAREVFINFGLYLVEFFRFSDIDKDYAQRDFLLIGREHLDNALKKGKGAILLTAHIGNWELGGMALALLGYPVLAIALDHRNHKINEFFKKRRLSKGMEVVSLGIAIKQCYKALNNNKLVAILGDRDFSNSSYSLNFLKMKKNIPRGPAVLAKRTGAPIIPVFVIRYNLYHLKMLCFPSIEISDSTTEIEIIQKYTKIIEEQIYKYPSQWLIFREFWKE